MSNIPKPIYLTHLNGTGYIFNINDYMKIRSEHHITGSLIGTTRSQGWTTPNSMGLPVELTKYETRLLIDEGLAVLVSKINLKNTPSEKIMQEFQETKMRSETDQEDIMKQNKIEESRKHVEKIIKGRRKKLCKSGVNPEDINITPDDVIREIEENYVFDKNNIVQDIPYEYPFEHDIKIITFPEDNSLKYRVFKDIWKRGKYITSGELFGGDFIAYPGDPLAFHASHIVVVLEDASVMPLDLITKVRLSVNVNKLLVLAYSNENNELCYHSVRWEGNKDVKDFSEEGNEKMEAQCS